MLGISLLSLLAARPVLASPPLPSSFHGTVKVGGENVSAGTVISVKIKGVQYTSTIFDLYPKGFGFGLDVPSDDSDTTGIIEGGVEGDTVFFYIGSTEATQTATWHGGTNVSLNLTGHTG